ncbi:hypothetical protein VTJ49DRAFT_2018 [Mycothermus thermophilus]|uniref:GrpE protein homolog n=1 Tax=Humicola insolens TaxID=85995 RepID=A0ABR3VAW0_HUMIN
MLRQSISATSRALRSTARLGTQRQSALRLTQSFQTPIAATRPIALRTRWYSSEAGTAKKDGEASASNGDKTNAAEEAKKEGEGESLEALKKQLEQKEAEVRDLKDRFLRSVADFRNLQDRTQREMKAARDFAIQQFAKDLVESVDNFDRALSMVPPEKIKPEQADESNKDLVSLYEGLKMTESILMQTLKKHGLERFDPQGEVFNPNEHEATFMTAMQDQENNTIMHVQQKGFKLNGRILRPAKVGVVKNK